MGSILSSQTDPPTIKNDDFTRAGVRFLKNHHFRSKDGFGSVFGASGSTKEGPQIRLRILLGLVCSRLAAEDGLRSVDVVFCLLSEPLGVDFELPN